MSADPWNVVVCGTRFGRVYMSAVVKGEPEMKFVGVLATGSERSRRCAERHSVPLFTDVEELPDGVDAACVAVSSELGGGAGTEIALRLLKRGTAVLQEHPMHHDELAKILAAAHRSGTVHMMSTLYPYVRPVRQFLAAGAALLQEHDPVFVDGACAIQLKTSFFDILGRTLGRLRPWEFQALPATRNRLEAPVPFRSIQGVVGGVPVSIRLQNQLHPTDPDNHCHLYHRLTLGTAVGSLCLVDTHGPVIWRPRPHIPEAIQEDAAPETWADPALDLETASVVAAPTITWRGAMAEEWPTALYRTLVELRRRASGERIAPDPQYYLSLSLMIEDVTLALGPPELICEDTPVPASGDRLLAPITEVS